MPHLWYPGCQVNENQNPYGPTFALKAFGVFDTASFGSPQSITLPNSYSTSAGDCIVVAYALTGSTSPTISGCGATWLSAAGAFDGGVNPRAGFNFGWGCTGGGTTISFANIGAHAGSVIIAVWSGVKSASTPLILGSANNNAGSTSTVLVTSGTTFSAGNLVMGMGGAATTTGTWTAGNAPAWVPSATSNLIAIDNNQQASRLDAYVAASGHAGIQLTQTAAAAAQLEAAVLVLTH